MTIRTVTVKFFLLLLVFLMTACVNGAATPSTLPAPAQTVDVPDFDIVAYQGEALLGGHATRFARVFERGKPVVLNFWAGLCPPCRAEMPTFQAIADEYADEVIVVGIDVGITMSNRLAVQLGSTVRHANSRGYFAYGLAYGAASLSCTMPIFLSVVGSALTVDGLAAGMLQFIVYALGMAFVIYGAVAEHGRLQRGASGRLQQSKLPIFGGHFIQASAQCLVRLQGSVGCTREEVCYIINLARVAGRGSPAAC